MLADVAGYLAGDDPIEIGAGYLLELYGGVYPEPEPGDTWTPIPLIRRIAGEVRGLGGDPGLVPPRSNYMREALGE
jgi:hypothetical protein